MICSRPQHVKGFTTGAWFPGKMLQPKEELKDQLVHWGGPVTSEALVGTCHPGLDWVCPEPELVLAREQNPCGLSTEWATLAGTGQCSQQSTVAEPGPCCPVRGAGASSSPAVPLLPWVNGNPSSDSSF